MIPRGKKLLKLAGALAMITGIVCVFVGFYVMASGMSIDASATEAQMQYMKLLSLGGFYVMANGIYHVVGGFVGFINAGELDGALKCRNYGFGMIGFSIVNIIALIVLTFTWKSFTIVLAVLPVLIAGLFYAGAYLNVLDEKAAAKDTDK